MCADYTALILSSMFKQKIAVNLVRLLPIVVPPTVVPPNSIQELRRAKKVQEEQEPQHPQRGEGAQPELPAPSVLRVDLRRQGTHEKRCLVGVRARVRVGLWQGLGLGLGLGPGSGLGLGLRLGMRKGASTHP